MPNRYCFNLSCIKLYIIVKESGTVYYKAVQATRVKNGPYASYHIAYTHLKGQVGLLRFIASFKSNFYCLAFFKCLQRLHIGIHITDI